jgi:hypothetical protein
LHPDDVVRKQDMQKAFTGKKEDIMDADIRDYLASDSDEGDEAADDAESGATQSKRELERKKLREALGLPKEPARKKGEAGPVGDMQITFSSALTGDSRADEADDKEATTIEKYKRKEKERKETRRKQVKAKREGADDVDNDEGKKGEDSGFNDPFFTTEDADKPSKSAIRKEERRKKREAVEAAIAEKVADTERLRQVMGVENDGDNTNDFDLRQVIKAAKEKKKARRKKGKKGKVDDAAEAAGDPGFEIDERFTSALTNDPNFALVADDSRFAYKSDRKIVEEEVRKRRGRDHGEDQPRKAKKLKHK